MADDNKDMQSKWGSGDTRKEFSQGFAKAAELPAPVKKAAEYGKSAMKRLADWATPSAGAAEVKKD